MVTQRCRCCRLVKIVDELTLTCETCKGTAHHQTRVVPGRTKEPEPDTPDPNGWCKGEGSEGYWYGPVSVTIPYKSPGRVRCPHCGRMLTYRLVSRDAWHGVLSQYDTLAATLPPHKTPKSRRRSKGPRRKERRYLNRRAA